MSSGPSRPFVSVKFSPVGRTYSFLLPELALDAPGPGSPDEPAGLAAPAEAPPLSPGDAVIVQTAEGRALGTVTRGIPALAPRKTPPDDSELRVVRRATHDDIVSVVCAAAGCAARPQPVSAININLCIVFMSPPESWF